jgi:hypothetical protein
MGLDVDDRLPWSKVLVPPTPRLLLLCHQPGVGQEGGDDHREDSGVRQKDQNRLLMKIVVMKYGISLISADVKQMDPPQPKPN